MGIAKFRYRFKDRNTGNIVEAIIPITEIEILGFFKEPFNCHKYEILSRDQYTGKKDRNGNEIYAGDRVRFSAHYFGDSREKECVEVIEWNNEECSYNWKLTETGWADGPVWCEVIGNVYETKGDNDG